MGIWQLKKQAKKHWEEFLPKKAKRLRARGMLDVEAQRVAVKAYHQIRSLVNQGMPEHMAEELVLPEEILLPPEEGAGISAELQAESAEREAAYQEWRSKEIRDEEEWLEEMEKERARPA